MSERGYIPSAPTKLDKLQEAIKRNQAKIAANSSLNTSAANFEPEPFQAISGAPSLDTRRERAEQTALFNEYNERNESALASDAEKGTFAGTVKNIFGTALESAGKRGADAVKYLQELDALNLEGRIDPRARPILDKMFGALNEKAKYENTLAEVIKKNERGEYTPEDFAAIKDELEYRIATLGSEQATITPLEYDVINQVPTKEASKLNGPNAPVNAQETKSNLDLYIELRDRIAKADQAAEAAESIPFISGLGNENYTAESRAKLAAKAEELAPLEKERAQKFQEGDYLGAAIDWLELKGKGGAEVIDALWEHPEQALAMAAENPEFAAWLAGPAAGLFGSALGAASEGDSLLKGAREEMSELGRSRTDEEIDTVEKAVLGSFASTMGLDALTAKLLIRGTPSKVSAGVQKLRDTARRVKETNAVTNRAGNLVGLAGKGLEAIGTELVQGEVQSRFSEMARTRSTDGTQFDAKTITEDSLNEGFGGAGLASGPVALGTTKETLGTFGDIAKATVGRKAKAAAEQSAAINSVREKFIDTGDLSVLDSEDTPLSAADKIDVILSRNSQESTPLEERITNRDAAFTILQDSQAKAVELQRTISDISTRYEQNPESVTAEEVAQLDAAKVERDELLDVVNKAGDYVKQLVATTTTQDELDSVADTIQSAATPEEAQSNVDTIINAAMLTPELVSSDTVRKALESNLLTDEQRSYLESFDRTMQSVRDAEKAIETMKGIQGVSRDVFEGNKESGWKGIKNYRQEIEAALRTGNTQLLQKSQNQLNNFLQGKQERADAFNAAYEEAMATGQRVQPLKADGTPYTYMANTGEVDAKGKPIYEERP